jgi:NDP-sugar pyrophosphorylase family protein
MVTMALVPNRDPEHYGGVRMAEDGQISGFVSRGTQAAGSYHFIGVQVTEADAFASLEDGEAINLFSVYEMLISSKPGSVRGYLCNAGFWDVGTPEDYAATDKYFGSVRLSASASLRRDTP